MVMVMVRARARVMVVVVVAIEAMGMDLPQAPVMDLSQVLDRPPASLPFTHSLDYHYLRQIQNKIHKADRCSLSSFSAFLSPFPDLRLFSLSISF